MNQKGNSLLYILIATSLLMLIGGGTYYLGAKKGQIQQVIPSTKSYQSMVNYDTNQPTPLPSPGQTASWKTYTDSTLAASFQYPPTWTLTPGVYSLSTTTIKDGWYVMVSDPKYGNPTCQGDCSTFLATFQVNKNPQKLNLTSYINDEFNKITNGTGDIRKVGIEHLNTANNLTFLKVSGFPGTNYFLLYTLHNDKVYIISVGAGVNGSTDDTNSQKVKLDLAIFDQMVSTFKFTN